MTQSLARVVGSITCKPASEAICNCLLSEEIMMEYFFITHKINAWNISVNWDCLKGASHLLPIKSVERRGISGLR